VIKSINYYLGGGGWECSFVTATTTWSTYNCSARTTVVHTDRGPAFVGANPGRAVIPPVKLLAFHSMVPYRRSMLFIKKHRTLSEQYIRSFTGGTVVHRDLLMVPSYSSPKANCEKSTQIIFETFELPQP
jgi:hypothetical protein